MEKDIKIMKIPIEFLTFAERSPSIYGDQTMYLDIFSEYTRPAEQEDRFRVIWLGLDDNKQYIGKVNEYINRFDGVLLIINNNEAGIDVHKEIKHPNMKIWLQTPHPDTDSEYNYKFIPLGYPSLEIKRYITNQERIYDFAFIGQITTPERKFMANVISRGIDGFNGLYLPTDRFNAGLPYDEYMSKLCQSKVVLCAGGHVTPDTFRVYEALEAGCIPVLGVSAGHRRFENIYWDLVFGVQKYPMPLMFTWSNLHLTLKETLNNYTEESTRVSDWWVKYKNNLLNALVSDFGQLQGMELISGV